jgi:uncharacterized protein
MEQTMFTSIEQQKSKSIKSLINNMKKNTVLSFIIGLLIVIGAAFIVAKAHGESIPPKPTNFVNDYAHVLSADFINQENKVLSDYQKATTNEIAVVLIPTTGDQSIEEYSIALADAWKPGVKGKDNGVILVLAMQDHHDRIEVGRGLEGELTDIQSENILNDMKPQLRAGDSAQAVQTGVNEIIGALNTALTPTATPSATAGSTEGFPIFLIILAIIVAIIAGVVMYNSNSDSGDSFPDDSGDSSDNSSNDDGGFVTGAIAGGLAGYGLGRSSHSSDSEESSSDSSDDDDSSSSSSEGFGSSSSSDDGGSSFGGFSGGSFSGGGASGGW